MFSALLTLKLLRQILLYILFDVLVYQSYICDWMSEFDFRKSWPLSLLIFFDFFISFIFPQVYVCPHQSELSQLSCIFCFSHYQLSVNLVYKVPIKYFQISILFLFLCLTI